MARTFVIILLLVLFTMVEWGLSQHNSGVLISCQDTQILYGPRNYTAAHKSLRSNDNLSICVLNATTCCTRPLREDRLHKTAQKDVRNLYRAKTDFIKKIFRNAEKELKAHFQDCIKRSETVLVKQLMNKYRSVYVNNSYITKAFYEKLMAHYRFGMYEIHDIVHDLFKKVFLTMYGLLKSPQPTNSERKCASTYYDKVKAFGDAPRQIIPRLKRSIIAARTYLNAIRVGKTIVENLGDDKWLNGKCIRSTTNMIQCSMCPGYSSIKPCPWSCRKVFLRCLSPFNQLKHEWNKYLASLKNLGFVLTNRYSLDDVFSELPDDIDEAISHGYSSLLGKAAEISTKYCQTTKKQRRSTVTSDNDDFIFVNNVEGRRVVRRALKGKGNKLTISSLLKKYDSHFLKFVSFWSTLPSSMCDKTIVASIGSKQCWNDTQLVVDNTAILGHNDSYANEENGGENNAEIRKMIRELESIILQMKTAINGRDVNNENDEELNGGSGSGSGNASGEGSGEEDDEGDGGNPSTDESFKTTTQSNEDDRVESVFLRTDPPDNSGNGYGASFNDVTSWFQLLILVIMLFF